MNFRAIIYFFFSAWICIAVCGCNSNGVSSAAAQSGDISDQQRITAAAQTAETTPSCIAVKPFYWEIGDVNGKLAGATAGGTSPGADNLMSIASASKLMYAAYVVQKRNGVLTPDDIKFLTFRSGYTSFNTCLPSQTVGECSTFQTNGSLHQPMRISSTITADTCKNMQQLL